MISTPTDDNVTIAIKKYESHPSIKMIKRTIGNDKQFEFTHIYPNDICSHIKRLNTSKSVSGQIPISIWKSAIDICGNKLTVQMHYYMIANFLALVN